MDCMMVVLFDSADAGEEPTTCRRFTEDFNASAAAARRSLPARSRRAASAARATK
jgi:hypothetical protein